MSYLSNPAPPEPKRRWLRFIFPVLVIALFGGAFAFSLIGTELRLDTDTNMGMYMAMFWLAPPIGLLLLGVWWLFFSGFPWRVRLLVLALPIVFVPALWIATVRGIEFTTVNGRMVPVLQFVWEPTALQKFDEFQQKQKTDGLPAIDATVGAEDFPRFRGAKTNGVVGHLKLQTDWKKYPPEQLWRHPLVGGYSGVAVAGNIVVTLEQRGPQEAVVCYDRATGRQRWAQAYDSTYKDQIYHKDVMGDGPRATPAIHDGLIFTLGATGYLKCFNPEGKEQWSKNILEDCQAKNLQWGVTGSPLIVNDLVVVLAGVDPEKPGDASLVAYEYKTGKRRWARGNRKAGYSSPQLATLAGVQQILMFDGDALAGFDPKDGRELWVFPWVTDMQQNMSQPVVIGSDRVFISSEVANGCAMLRFTAPEKDEAIWTIETVWKNKKMAARFSNPVSDGTHIFALHNIRGILKCLSVEKGDVLWTGDEYGPGQMLLVDDTLLLVNDKGEVLLLDPAAAEETVLARYQVLDARTKTWNTPAIASDQLFIRNQSEIAAFKLPRR